jgi:hypothetical protein
MQNYLAARGMDLQQTMSQAGQKDVYGNQLMYDPNTNTWVSLTSPQGQALLNRSDAIQRQQDIRNINAETERSMGTERRVQAGEGAGALLNQFTRGYGAPTKEGTIGAAKVAGATGATEPADIAKSGFTAAALRTGAGGVPLQYSLDSADRGATAGLRTSLAQDYSPLYQEMKANWTGNTLNPRSPLVGEATTPDMPFSPSTIPSTLDSAALNRSTRAPSTVYSPYTGFGANTANAQLIAAIGAQKLPAYGAMASGLGDTWMKFFDTLGGKNPPTVGGTGGP